MSKHRNTRPSDPPEAPLVKAETTFAETPGGPAVAHGEEITGGWTDEAAPTLDDQLEAAADAPASSTERIVSDDQLGAILAGASDVITVIKTAGGLVEVHEPGRDVAGKPSTIDLEDVLAHFDITPADVLNWRGGPEADEGLVVVTTGGEKIRWPQDIDRTIPRARLSATAAAPREGRVFEGGYLRRDASKDPKD